MLVLFTIGVIEVKGYFSENSVKREITLWHIQAGLCVFLLVWGRMAWRWIRPVPPISPPLSRIQLLAAKLGHFALYFMMLALPIAGILARQSKGNDVTFFGHLLPALLDEDKSLPYALTIGNIHAYLGDAMIALLAAHIAAAIFHHLIRQDDTLLRMLPWRQIQTSKQFLGPSSGGSC